MADTIVNHGPLEGFTYVASGTNAQGNHWCARDYDNGASAYHYSNNDGSYYYANPDGSRYFNNGHGAWIFTSPTGQVTTYTPPPQ